MRSTCSRSSASRTPSAPDDSPAWAVRPKPSSPARRYADANRGPVRPDACLVAVDRQPDDASRAGRAHPLDERLGLVAGLGPQDRQQQVARRQPLGLGPFEPGGQGVGERAELPPGPVGRVDDHLGVDDAVGAGPCGVVVGHLGGQLRRPDQPARPVEEAEERRQVVEREQSVARAGQVLARLRRPSRRCGPPRTCPPGGRGARPWAGRARRPGRPARSTPRSVRTGGSPSTGTPAARRRAR